MLLLIPIVLMIGTGAVFAILHALRPQFRFSWLGAIGATSVAWLMALLWHPRLPLSLVLPLWSFAASPPTLPAFSAVDLSWPYTLCLTTLALAVLLTAPARPDFPNPSRWSLSLGLAGLGLFATIADGPLTLAWCWAGMDLAELVSILRHRVDRELGRRALAMFSVRLAGVGAVLLALAASGAGAAAPFAAIPAPQAVLLPAAALLRLLAYVAPWPKSAEPILRGGVGTTVQLAGSAGSIAFLSRVELGTPTASVVSALLVICAGIALYAGWMWLRSPDGFVGRPLWSLGLGSLAVASALRGNPAGSTGWSLALVLAGTAQLVSNMQPRWRQGAMWIGAWLLSALPFSVTATGLMSAAGKWSLLPLLLAQAMLAAGYIHNSTRPTDRDQPDGNPVWMRSIHAAGIGLPLAVGLLLGIWGWEGAMQLGVAAAAVPAAALALGLVWAKSRFPLLNPIPARWFPAALTAAFAGLRRQVARLYRVLQGLSDSTTRIMEGEAGIMWSLLLLALFASLIAGGNP